MNIIAAISRGMAALRAGEALADPALWKNRQAAINAVTVAITAGAALADLFGLHIPLAEWASDLAYGCVGVVTIYLTYATSPKVGLPPPPKEPADGDASQSPLQLPVIELQGRPSPDVFAIDAGAVESSRMHNNAMPSRRDAQQSDGMESGGPGRNG